MRRMGKGSGSVRLSRIREGGERERGEKMMEKVKGTARSSRMFTLGLVVAWYSSNIGVLLLNKYLLSNYDFKYPIFLTMCHMTACSLISYAAIAWMKVVPMQAVRSRVQFFKIAALSIVFCGSVVSGNVSLWFLPVSFNQAVGSTTPFFTAVFAYIMTVFCEAWITYITLIPIVTGVIIASGIELLLVWSIAVLSSSWPLLESLHGGACTARMTVQAISLFPMDPTSGTPRLDAQG